MVPIANDPAAAKAVAYPYPGLRAFDTDESEIFFGRTDHVDDLLVRLKNKRFLGIVGPSGCGKSSLIRAGVIPDLHAGLVASASGWQVAVMRPGTQPLKNLSLALQASAGAAGEPFAEEDGFLHTVLRRGPLGLVDALAEYRFDAETNLLLVVDQFEELFRFERDSDGAGAGAEEQAFVELLLASARSTSMPIYVILTMRSDYLGRCPIFRGLPEMLNDSQYLTPRLNRDQQRQAIEAPAQMFNTTVRPEVVNRILNEMGSDPDQLPLMQHLLMRMWRKEQERTKNPQAGIELTLDNYKEAGGLSACVLTHADSVYARLQEGERRIAELMWRRLTDVSADGELTRRECEFGKLGQELVPSGNATELAALRKVVEEFRADGRSFLMPPPREPLTANTPIDVSHESIIRQWKTLRNWAYAEHTITRTRKNVAEKARRRKADPNKAGYLLSGVDLAEAKNWQKTYPHQPSPDEAALLQESIAKEEEDVRKEEELKYAGSLKRMVRWLIAAAFVSLFLAGLGAFFAWTAREYAKEADQQKEKANTQKEEAVKQAKRAGDNEKLANGNLKKYEVEADINRAARLAKASRDTMTQPQLRLLLALEARQAVGEARLPFVEDTFVKALSAFDRFGISSTALPGHRQRITSMNLINDQWLLTGSEDETVRLWPLAPQSDVSARSIVLPGQAGKVSVVAAHPDGRWAAAGSVDGTLRVWNIENPRNPRLAVCLHAHVSRIADLEFSAGGPVGAEKVQWLVTAADDGTACRWDVSDLSDPAKFVDSATPLGTHTEAILDLAIAKDGLTLATGSKDGTVRVMDLRKPTNFPLPKAHSGWVNDVAVSSDSRWLATCGNDWSVKLWDLAGIRSGSNNHPQDLVTRIPVRVVVFTNNKGDKKNRWLAVGGDDPTVRFWNLTPVEELKGAKGKAALPNPSGRYFLTATDEHASNFTDAKSTDTTPPKTRLADPKITPLGPGRAVKAIAFDADDRWVAMVREGSAVIWVQRFDTATGPVGKPLQLVGHEGEVTQLAFRTIQGAPLLLSGGSDGIVRQWDLSQDNWGLSKFEPLPAGLPNADWIDKGRFLFLQSTKEGLTFTPYQQVDKTQKHLGPKLVLPWPEPGVDPSRTKEIHAAAGQYLAVALPNYDKKIHLNHLGTDESEQFWTFLESSDPINGLALTRVAAKDDPGSYRLAAVTGKQLRVWFFKEDFWTSNDAEDEILNTSNVDSEELHDVMLSADGKWAGCHSGGRLLLCPVEYGGLLQKLWLRAPLGTSDDFVSPVKFSALMFNRGTSATHWFAAADELGQIYLYNLNKGPAGAVPWRLTGIPHRVTSLRFSPNDGWLAALGAEGLSVWNLSSIRQSDQGQPVAPALRIELKDPAVTRFSFDPRERWIVTGDKAGRLLQWALRQHKAEEQPSPVRCFDGRFGAEQDPLLRREIVALNFADDDTFMAVAADGAVRRWRLAAAGVTNAELWRRLGRSLTAAEWDNPLLKVGGDKPFYRPVDTQVLHAFLLPAAAATDREQVVRELTKLLQDEPNANLARFSDDVKAIVAARMVDDVIDRARKPPEEVDVDRVRLAGKLTPSYRVNENRLVGTLTFLSKLALSRSQVDVFFKEVNEAKDHDALRTFALIEKNLSDGDAQSLQVKLAAARAHTRIAEGMVEAGNMKEARKHLVAAHELDPSLDAADRALAWMQRDQADELLRNCTSSLRDGNTKVAEVQYRQAQAIDPSLTEPAAEFFKRETKSLNRALAERSVTDTLALARKGDLAAAAEKFRAAQKLDSSYQNVMADDYVGRARAGTLIGEARGAIVKSAQTLLMPKASIAKLNFDLPLGKLTEAAKLDSRLTLDPESYLNFLVGRGLRLTARELGVRNDPRMKEVLAQAEKHLRAAGPLADSVSVKIDDPDKLFERYAFLWGKMVGGDRPNTDPTTLSMRIEKLATERKFAEADTLLRQLRELDPLIAPDAAAWNSLCWYGAFYDPQNVKQYVQAGEMAVLLQPDNGRFRDARGLARALAGDYQGASADFAAFADWTSSQRKRHVRLQLIEDLDAVRAGKKTAAEVLSKKLIQSLDDVVFRSEAAALTKASARDPLRKDVFRDIHPVAFTAGKKYTLSLTASYPLHLQIEDSQSRLLFDTAPGRPMVFPAQRTGDHRVIVSAAYANLVGPYQLIIQEADDPDRLIFEKTAELTRTDPFDTRRPSSHCKTYDLELTTGVLYTIRMESSQLDSYLRLEDAKGNQLAFNDDSEGTLNSRIDFTPRETGRHRIIATTFQPGALGRFRVTVSTK